MRSMSISERNKAIKKALSEEFGYKNVKVRGGRGTAYGWVHVYITAEKPHSGECDEKGWIALCDKCREKMEEVKNKAWEILKKTGLDKELGVYYDDMGYKHKEIIIDVELKEGVEAQGKTDMEKREIEVNESYKVVHEGSWTWVYFKEKPGEEIREKLKSMGFRFSKRRLAWYLTQKVEVSL